MLWAVIDGAHLSMSVDSGGGCCQSIVVVGGLTSAFANACPPSWVLMVGGCHLCGQSGPFWVCEGSHHSCVAEVGISRCW